MTPERWERIAEIFEAAQTCPRAERSQVLQQLCGGDADLQAEVEALLASAAAASGFLSDPVLPPREAPAAAAPPRWEPGVLLAGRFAILRLLGRGGMGDVYAARDRELGIDVALKVVRADIAADPLALARFKREILTARRISHPNVCRIYDLAIEPGAEPTYFLTMELLSGETLADQLQRQGPPLEPQARRWLAEIAAGLDAAHAAGVIHRDFKPGNVMFRPASGGEPEAVITDFGLARWTAVEPAGSSGTRLIGTLAYMAPEQLAGGAVMPATDVYAFGLVAYEVLTGHAPHEGDGPLGGVLQRLRQGYAPPSAVKPGLDPAWDGVIAACLAEDPAQRAASAAAALAALPPSHPRRRVSWPRRAAAGILAAAAVMALIAVALRYYRVRSEIAAGSEILMTAVTNASGDSQLDGATVLLREQLAQSAQFHLTSPAQALQQLQRMDEPASVGVAALSQRPALAREVAMRRGAPLVVFENLSRLAGKYQLAFELERVGNDPDAAARTWTVTETADSKSDLFDALHDGANWVRRLAGEQPEVLASTDQPPRDITTPSWQALDYYSRAEAERAARHTSQAIALLRQATVTDPGFALAYTRLGDILISLGQDADGYAAYRQALALADQRRLSQRERLLLQGDYDEDTWNWEGAVRSFQAYAALYPNDPLGWFYQGNPDAQLGRDAAAQATWQHAAKLAPHADYIPSNVFELDMLQADFAAARKDAQQAGELGLSDYADLMRGEIAFSTGDAGAAERSFSSAARSANPTRREEALSATACLWAELGKYANARAALQAAIVEDERNTDTGAAARAHLGLAYLALRSGDRDGAQREAALALALSHSPQNLAASGSLLAQSGDFAGARRALALLQPLQFLQPVAVGAANRIRGEILLAEGRPTAALPVLEAAARISGQLELPPLYLASALDRAGRREAALRLYDQWTRTPGTIWLAAFLHLPGRFADLTFQAARLSDELGRPDARGRWQRYLQLRRGADARLPEVAYARQRLAATDRGGRANQ